MEFVTTCVFIVFIQTTLAIAAPASNAHHLMITCLKTMKENGLTERFPGAVAHGIHSITLEDIRYYFKSNATEANNIPTLNYNISEKSKLVLPHVKLYGYDTSFKTISMGHLDQVLRDMDKKNWYLANYSTLEKLVHTIHMNEVWAKAKMHYDSISLLGYNTDLCECVKDTHNNGLLQMLHLMALQIRYPGLTSGNYEDGKITNGYPFHYPFRYPFHIGEWSSKLENFDFSGNIEDVKKRASTELVDGDQGWESLTRESVWDYWKGSMKRMDGHNDYELAMFLYCMLN